MWKRETYLGPNHIYSLHTGFQAINICEKWQNGSKTSTASISSQINGIHIFYGKNPLFESKTSIILINFKIQIQCKWKSAHASIFTIIHTGLQPEHWCSCHTVNSLYLRPLCQGKSLANRATKLQQSLQTMIQALSSINVGKRHQLLKTAEKRYSHYFMARNPPLDISKLISRWCTPQSVIHSYKTAEDIMNIIFNAVSVFILPI